MKKEIKFYNTLKRKKEEFKPLKKGKVGIYSCGPTVYWYQHVGNLRSYIFADILKRVLLYNGYKVKHIMNVTDVGHLTSDADTGEDKVEKAAKKQHKTAKEISQYYFSVFKKDLEKLNILPPNTWVWASRHIKEQIEMVKKLQEKGYTYETSDGVYFDTSKFKDYGRLSRKKIKDLKAGERVALGEKKNKTDFALWKFSNPPGKRQQEWNPKNFGADWKIGFPGWHIECSAMSSKYLGKQFDIHTGGEDHITIHHENEIAEAEAAFGKKPWVRFWMHGAFLNFRGGKMSKSKGEILTLSELEEKGFDALAYRYFTFTAHYKKPLTWGLENLKRAQESYKRIKKIISKLKQDKKTNERYIDDFEKAINNDLNMPGALEVLWKLLRDKKAQGKIGAVKKMDKIFALDLLRKEKEEIPEEIKKLADKREKLRKQKKWKQADKLREKIYKIGYIIEDIKRGYKLEENAKREI
jgi:cysteinyl-tRNA synthetase